MSKFTLKWGILATGGIAETFTKDLTVDPSTRERPDISHKIVAAASSTSADRAQEFLKKVGASEDAKAYGSYKDLVADKNADIIYVATPHSHHYQNVMLCLEAGKNVLCEKALTVNAAQTEKLIQKAKEKNLFFMEAVSQHYQHTVQDESLMNELGVDSILPYRSLRSGDHSIRQTRHGGADLRRPCLCHASRDYL